jgi:hypothetical protein
MRGDIPPLHNTPSWCDAQLKHKNNFTFTFNKEEVIGKSRGSSAVKRGFIWSLFNSAKSGIDKSLTLLVKRGFI